MSHSQKIKTNFVDFTHLKAALASFGWNEIREKSTATTYGSDPSRNKVYDLVAVNPKHGYDLGFMRENGKIEAYGDFFGGHLSSAFGVNLCDLKQSYAKSVFTSDWESQGYTVFSSEDAEGNLLLEAELA